MTSEEWTPYIAAWQERRRRASKALNSRVEIGRATAQECARVLVEQFGARRVWLFGSLAHRNFAHTKSDIDLAVEALPPEKYFPALTDRAVILLEKGMIRILKFAQIC